MELRKRIIKTLICSRPMALHVAESLTLRKVDIAYSDLKHLRCGYGDG